MPNLQNWWDVFTRDYFSQIEEWANSWADQAITAAAAPYLSARNQGRNPQTYAQVINTLQQWQQLLDTTRLRFPPYTGSVPLPQPPSSAGSASGSSPGGSAGGSSAGGSAGGSSAGGSAGGSSAGGSSGGSP